MLRRANIALMSAVVPGFLAYTGWVDALTPTARFLALALLGFAAVSFLLALFEDEDLPVVGQAANIERVQVPQSLPLVLSQQQVARIAP